MKIKFAEDIKSDTLDFQNGEYRRSFDRKEQPFDVTDEEWLALQATGYFEPFKEADQLPTPDTQSRANKRAQDKK